MVSLRALVHIGPMKTGTTAFAAACTQAQRAGILPPGLLYPMGELWFDDDRSVVKHHQFNAAAHGRPAAQRARDRKRSGVDELERAVIASSAAARERAVDGDASFIVVAEGLSHQVNPVGLTTLLRRHVDQIDYVLVARRQPRAVGSIMAHGVKDIGAPTRWHLNAADYLARPSRARRFDYARIVEGWRHDGATLHVVPFDESSPGSTQLTDAIMDRVGLPRLPVSETMSTRRTHPSFSAEGLSELARIKKRRVRFGWLPGSDDRYRTAFSAAWERHHRMARSSDAAPWRLSPAEESIVVAAYSSINTRFRELLGAEAESAEWREWFASVGIDSDAGATHGGRE